MAIFRRIANLFRRSRIDREIEAELKARTGADAYDVAGGDHEAET